MYSLLHCFMDYGMGVPYWVCEFEFRTVWENCVSS